MTKCRQCSSSFEVTSLERTFYQKIAMPEPYLCPECRRQRRFSFRNERKLYHRKCDLTGKQIISIYRANSPYKVYDQHEWHSDKWDGMDYGRDFDFSRPFFEQMNELMLAAPKISVFTSKNENSDYTNGSQQNKDCYMIFVSDHDENCYYSYSIFDCKDCIDCVNCFGSVLCVECIDCSGCYNMAFSEKSHNCRDSYFLSDCKGCRNCFGCYGLRNKEYHIFNKKLSKEEYETRLRELNTGNINAIRAAQDAFAKKVSQQQIHQYMDGNNNVDSTGDHIVNCKNSIDCYDSKELEDCGYLIFSNKAKDCFDGHVVVDNSELCCETISTINQYNTQFTFTSWYSKNSQYLDHCVSCEDCFGCSGLKRKRYCILNKQYSKEGYFNLKSLILSHTQKARLPDGQAGEYGQFFPGWMSPFGYNETVAQEYYPLSKEEVKKRKWNWYDEDDGKTAAYQGPVYEIPKDIKDVPDDIVNKVLICKKTGKPYRIIKQELRLYRLLNLPLPRMTFDARHLERIQKRNPRVLYSRKCKKCSTPIKTTYAPERPEIVFCEQCYLKEIY